MTGVPACSTNCVTISTLQDTLEADLDDLQLESFDPTLQFLVANLRRTLSSKCVDVENSDAEKLTIDGFEESLRLCAEWRPQCVTERDKLLLGTFREYATHEDRGLSFITHATMFQEGGAGSGRAAGTEARTLYQKLWKSELTTTHEYLIPLYNRYVSLLPEWASAENARVVQYGGIKVIPCSMLSTVAKKRTIRRTTCKEPTLDMYFQLGLGALIQKRLKMLGVSLRSQPRMNRVLAQIGSVTGEFATIDLKSASDRISLKMMRYFFPHLAGLVESVSSRTAEFKNGKVYDLTMLSTMGNGCTFPLQTLIFCTVVHTVMKLRGLRFNGDSLDSNGAYVHHRNNGDEYARRKSWGVFGDDIVVPRTCYDDVCRLCELLGFEVNVDKSFNNGSFRESCGGDFMNGYNVRGLYVKTLLRPQDRYNAANRLIAWGARHGLEFPKSLLHLLQGIPHRYVPMWSDVNCGLRTPFVCTNMSEKYKFWHAKADKEELPMVGGGAAYLAFLGGYLRTEDMPFEADKPFRLCPSERQGYIGCPLPEDIREVQYTLRRGRCPEELWDGAAYDGMRVVDPLEYARLEIAVVNHVVRREHILTVGRS